MTSDARAPLTGRPRLEAALLEDGGAFVRSAGLVVDEVTSTRVSGHIEVGPDHHTPWGIVHDGDAVFSPPPRSGYTGELPFPVSGLMREGGLIGSL